MTPATTIHDRLRRTLLLTSGACALALVCGSPALAGNGNGGGNPNPPGSNGNGNGDASGGDNGQATGNPHKEPPSSGDPAPPTDGTPPSDGAVAPPPDEGSAPVDDGSTPADPGSPEPTVEPGDGTTSPPESANDDETPDVTPIGSGGGDWETIPASAPAPSHAPAPKPNHPAQHASSAQAPSAPASLRPPAHRDPKPSDYGVKGSSAKLAVRHDGVHGGPAIRVELVDAASSYAFSASRAVRVARRGALYRIGAWLRSDVPGVSVCLRIKEVSAADPRASVRTTETCLSPTATWQRFRILRGTLARGNKLVFSIYSYGAIRGDSFEVAGFTVMRKTVHGWKRVPEAFGDNRPR